MTYRTQTVVTQPARAATFLVLTVRDGAEAQVKEAFGGLSGIARAVGFRLPEAELSCVVGIGSDLWDRMFTATKPKGLHPFVPLQGERHVAPATPGDLLIQVRAERPDMCFALARHLVQGLGAVDVVDEVQGFRFFDERDLLGFVDGTENPEGQDAEDAVTIGAEDPAYAGGSYVIVQKYLHDLTAWEALTVEEQEAVIGRHKLDDLEFADDDKAPNAHNVVTSITDDDGNDLPIVRENLPFGSVGSEEFGTYFIGYARDPAVTERMLRRMFVGEPEGMTDRILDFSTAHTGSLYFVPTRQFLDDPPD